jgi:hypothetical protein
MATTVTLKPNAIDLSGSTSGTTTLQATAVAGTTTITLPAATDTLVGKATTDTLTNKTLTSPTITGGALNGTLGATTPSTVAATTISASSTATFAAGAVGTPSITTTGDTNTGIYFPAADTIAFTEGGAESMRITSVGDVVVGSTSALSSGKFSLITSLASANGIVLKDSATSYGNTNNFVLLQNSTAVTAGALTHPAASSLGVWGNDDIRFLTSGAATERMRIDSSGRVLVGLTSANTSGANFQVSSGVTFPATQSASSDANTLDDYEEGTFSASCTCTSGSITVNANTCYYVKIGREVSVQGFFTVASVSSPTGALNINGLPFTGAYRSPGIAFGDGLSASASGPWIGDINAGTALQTYKLVGGVLSVTAAADVKASTSIWFQATYFI